MNTFLPYADFHETAKCLDSKRLGKQRLEAKQILDLLTGKADNSWKFHPCVKMWNGYETVLKVYYNAILQEWIRRGYRNAMKFYEITGKVEFPSWLGRKDFHDAHRSNLLRKNFEYYKQFGWKVKKDLKYVWG